VAMSFDLQYPFSLRGIMGEANCPIERPSEAKVGERPSQDPTIVCPIVFQSKRLGAGQPASGYCEDCIQTHFLNKDIFCPNCEPKVTSPDKLRIDKPMYKKVINYSTKEIDLRSGRRWKNDGHTKDSTPADFRSRSQVPNTLYFTLSTDNLNICAPALVPNDLQTGLCQQDDVPTDFSCPE
jgi:hypothetical protein